MMNIKQTILGSNVVGPEDIASAAETNPDVYIDIRGKGRSFAMLCHCKLTSTKTAICQLTCATDAAGTSVDDVSGKTVTLTGDAGALGKVGMIWFEAADLDLDNAHYFVGVDITTNQNGDNIGAVLLCVPSDLYATMNT